MVRIGVGMLLLLGFAVSAGQVQAAKLGDVTGEGEVTVADAVRLLRFAVQSELPTVTQMVLGDVYPRPGEAGRPIGDQRITVQDVTQVLRFSVGLITAQDFGANDAFIALSPSSFTLGPRDQLQFIAVPVNFEGPITWGLDSDSPRPGDISTDGIYTAPEEFFGDFAVSIIAQSGALQSVDNVYVTYDVPPPPPPFG